MERSLERKWYKLDNAAKIYPAIAGAKDSCVFRIAVNLLQYVDKGTLQQAVSDLRRRFPSMYVKLKGGLFWNYYESNEKTPVVLPESPFINRLIDTHANHGYQFTVFYYRNRISLEVFHGLCDGIGALEYLKAIVYRYFEIKGIAGDGEGRVLTAHQTPRDEETEDSFQRYFTPEPHQRSAVDRAYRIRGTRFSNGLGVISGKMETKQLVDLAKRNGATVTQYLCAGLTYAIRQSDEVKNEWKPPVNICVPVNLRKFYPSNTLRNFSLFFHTSTQYRNDNPSFDEILDSVKKDFVSELTRERLQHSLNANVSFEKNMALRLCPLTIKHVGMRIGSERLFGKLKTCTLSNMGVVVLPSQLTRLVRDFECHMPVGKDASHGISVVSCNARTAISFSRKIRETDIEKHFFSYLAQHGVDIEIQSNLWENHA